MQIAYKHANDPMPLPSSVNPQIPEQLDDLVQWATEKDPEDRPADATEMLRSLRQAERELAITPALQREPSSFLDNPTGNLTKVLPTDDAAAVMPPAPPPAPPLHTAPTAGAPEPVFTPEPEPEPTPIDNATVLRLRTKQRSRRRFLLLLVTLIAAAGALFAGLHFSVGAGANVSVPDVVGQTEASARSLLADAELTSTTSTAHSGEVPQGAVIEQTPNAGESVAKQTNVALVISLGPEPVTLSSSELIGLSRTDAETLVRDRGLTLDPNPILWYSPGDPKDQVTNVRTAPAGSTPVDVCEGQCDLFKGDVVKLSISLGAVPNVVGQPEADARSALEAVGLRVAAETEQTHDSSVAAGSVIAVQTNDIVMQNDEVRLVVSLGPELFAVPDVVRMTRDEAVATLENAGFVAQINGLAWGLSDSATEVSRQDPAAGEMREQGTPVSLSLNIFGL